MYVSTNYAISFKGPQEEIEKISSWVLTLFDDEGEISEDGVIISDTRKIWWVPEIIDLAREIVKRSQNISAFTIKGTVDNSVCMDFLITYENGSLFVQDSDWYLIMAPDEDDDYEEFCDIYGDYSEEEFEKFKKCPHYILNEGHGEVVSSVPLCAPELVVDKKRIKLSGDTPQEMTHEDDFTTLASEKASDIINHPALWNDLASYLNGEWLHNNSKTVTAFAVAYILADQGFDLAKEYISRRKYSVDEIAEKDLLFLPKGGFPLEGTQYEGRAARCENIVPGTVLQGKLSNDEKGEFIEFFYSSGSVGCHTESFSPPLIALLKLDKINISAEVISCVPKSKRGPRARNAEVIYKLIVSDKAI